MIGRLRGLGIAFCLLSTSAFAQTKPNLKVWIIPAENAGPNEIARGEDIRVRVDAFNRSLQDSGVTVLNTVDPVLTMKLVSWNPAFAVPNASVVLSQQRTLAALKSFAASNQVRVLVRFITWDEAFGLLSELNPSLRSESYPDVVQIGSTWVGYLAHKGMLLSRPDWNNDRANWQPAAGIPAAILPYITDVRLLFYWKRLPSTRAEDKQLTLNGSSWESIIASIRDGASAGDTLALPTGLTLNVLHDYAPLVWAGSGDFTVQDWFGSRVDLTSAKALFVPTFLMKNALIEPKAGEPRRIIAFPESSHEEVSRIFVNGGYRAILEPANFIDRWRQDFNKRALSDLLRQLGITADEDFATRLITACQQYKRAATQEEVFHFVSDMAARSKASREPTKFLLSVVPEYFDQRASAAAPVHSSAADKSSKIAGRSFWDYAGVVVPPAVFKGGSDLVVFKGTSQPAAAFALADFLATDPEFTRVLAEAGHLPAGRPGYGIDVLLTKISGPETDPEAREFARSVQKAIDQGRTYPQLDVWPSAIENTQVLEALQSVWRRMGEGNAVALHEAASQAEWAINSRMNWWYWLVDRTMQSWQVIAIVVLAALGVVVALIVSRIRAFKAAVRAQEKQVEAQAVAVRAEGERVRTEADLIEAERKKVREEEKRVKAERDLVLLLNLLRARRHEAAKFLGDNLRELAAEAEHDQWEAAAVLGQVQKLSVLFEDSLVPYIDEISENQFKELTGCPGRLGLNAIVDKAYNGARYIFEAKNRVSPPYVCFTGMGLSKWYLETLPYAAVVILEEWFLNCFRYFHGHQVAEPRVTIDVAEGNVLCIQSSGCMSEREQEPLRREPFSATSVDVGHQGLPLIRNILHYAYGATATITTADDDIELRIPLPLRPATTL